MSEYVSDPLPENEVVESAPVEEEEPAPVEEEPVEEEESASAAAEEPSPVEEEEPAPVEEEESASAAAEEPAPVEEESSPVEEEESASAAAEEPAPVEEESAPVEEEESASAAAEEPAPVEEEEPAPVEEEEPAPVEEEEPAPVEEEPVEESSPVEQVASEIREILTPVESVNEVETSSESIYNDNVCSLKTLVDVLGKWSGNEIRRRQVEDFLKEGTEKDENLDDLEKVFEIIQLWMEKGSEFKTNNYFLKLDEYTLVEESRNLDSEKKNKLLGKLIKFLIDCSQGKYNNEEILVFFNNFY